MYRIIGALVAATGFFAAGSASAQEEPLKLMLVCDGVHRTTEQEITNITAHNQNYSQSANGHALTQREVELPRRISVVFEGETARIRLPRPMTPTFSKSQDGWYTLSEVRVTDRLLSGKLSLNAINKPTLKIDRTTGDVELRGFLMDFSGACERGSDDPQARKF